MKPRNDSIVKNVIELALLPGVGSLTQNRLWKLLPNIADIFSMKAEALESFGIPEEAHPIIRSRSYQAIAEEIYDWSIREGCCFLVRGEGVLFEFPLLCKK